MLLVAVQVPPMDAAELILHMWYSARLTQDMLATIDTYVKQPVSDVVDKIKSKPHDIILSKKWTFGAAEVTVRLYKQQWDNLLRIFAKRHDVAKTERERQKVVWAPSRVDWRDRALCLLAGAGRMNERKFRDTGILAPFGSCLDHFEVSNP